MNKLILFSLLSFSVTSCCLFKNCGAEGPYGIRAVLRDKLTNEDLFKNGTLALDSVTLQHSNGYQNLFVEDNGTYFSILFFPSTDDYTISVGSSFSVNIEHEQRKTDDNCCVSFELIKLESTPYEYETNSLDNGDYELTILVE